MIEVIRKFPAKKVFWVLPKLHGGKTLHLCSCMVTERFENGIKFRNHSSFSKFTYLRIGYF